MADPNRSNSHDSAGDLPTVDRSRRFVHIGEALPRVEDERLLRGGGRYVSDLIATSKALRVIFRLLLRRETP